MNNFPDKYLAAIDTAAAQGDYFLPVLATALGRISAPAESLDVGCGTGVFGIQLKRFAASRLTGVDGSEYAVQAARAAGYDEVVQVADLDRDSLPFDSRTFDFCLCKDVLEHLVSPEHALREIARVLKPGGHVLVHVPNHFTLYGRMKLFTSNTIDAYGYFPDADRWNFPHIRFFTFEALTGLAANCGLRRSDDFCGFYPAIPLGRLWLPVAAWRRALAHRFPDLFSEGFSVLFCKSA